MELQSFEAYLLRVVSPDEKGEEGVELELLHTIVVQASVVDVGGVPHMEAQPCDFFAAIILTPIGAVMDDTPETLTLIDTPDIAATFDRGRRRYEFSLLTWERLLDAKLRIPNIGALRERLESDEDLRAFYVDEYHPDNS